MDSRYKIEILTFEKIRGDKYHLVFQMENIKYDYNINIIDGGGVFGVEMPSELGLKLREFPFSHKEIVNAVKPVYEKLFPNQLQVA